MPKTSAPLGNELKVVPYSQHLIVQSLALTDFPKPLDLCAGTHYLGKQQQGVAVLELARVVGVL